MESLKEYTTRLEKCLESYKALRAKAKAFDGKILNKKFVDTIEQDSLIGVSVERNADSSHKMCIWNKLMGYNNNMFYSYSIEKMGIVKDKRFNYSQFNEHLTQQENTWIDQLTKVKADVIDGLTRLGKYNELIEQAQQLKDQMSWQFVETFKSEFKRNYI